MAARGAVDRSGIIDIDESAAAALVQQLALRGDARHGVLRSTTAEKSKDRGSFSCTVLVTSKRFLNRSNTSGVAADPPHDGPECDWDRAMTYSACRCVWVPQGLFCAAEASIGSGRALRRSSPLFSIDDPFALWPSFLFSRSLLLAELLEHLMQELPLLFEQPLAELLDHAQIVLLPLPQPATPRGPLA